MTTQQNPVRFLQVVLTILILALGLVIVLYLESCSVRLHPGNNFKGHHFYKKPVADSTKQH